MIEMKLVFILISFSLFVVSQSSRVYSVTASRIYSTPIISKATGSVYDFNYNAALYNNNGFLGLIVRCQNLKNESVPFAVGPSFLSSSLIAFNSSNSPIATPTVSLAYVPNNTTETCGTEDPRITFFNGTYYMFFTAYNCSNAMLSSSTSTNPADPNSWVRNGFVFPEKSWSKSGAALFATPQNNLSQHYLFWGDSSTPAGGIGIATSMDTIHWNDTGNFLLKIRNDSFDSNLVESGPSPIQLATGDFFFIYNSARSGYPSVKPSWDLQYNVGFAILSATDPTTIVQRSDSPILSPTTDWEIGNTASYVTPNVVFLEGLVSDPNGCPANTSKNSQCFFGVYGGSDSDLGAVQVIVSWTDSETTSTPASTTTTTPSSTTTTTPSGTTTTTPSGTTTTTPSGTTTTTPSGTTTTTPSGTTTTTPSSTTTTTPSGTTTTTPSGTTMTTSIVNTTITSSANTTTTLGSTTPTTHSGTTTTTPSHGCTIILSLLFLYSVICHYLGKFTTS